MSSILDALKKLEAEKAEANKPVEAFDGDGGDDIIKRSPLRSRMTIKISPTMIAVGMGAFVLLCMAASVGVSMMLLKPAEPTVIAQAAPPAVTSPPVPPVQPQPQQTVSPTQAPSPMPPASQPVAEPAAPATPPPTEERAPVEQVVAHKAEVEVPTVPVAAVEKPAQKPVELSPAIAETKPEPAPQRTPVKPTKPAQEAKPIPEPEPAAPVETKIAEAAPEPPAESEPPTKAEPDVILAKADVAPVKPQRAQRPEIAPSQKIAQPIPAEPAKPKMPQSIFRLPILRRAVAEQHGLDGIQINRVAPPDKTRPYGSAIINLESVYTGEKIPGTDAILIAVEKKGIAVEIEGTSDRYHIPFGWR